MHDKLYEHLINGEFDDARKLIHEAIEAKMGRAMTVVEVDALEAFNPVNEAFRTKVDATGKKKKIKVCRPGFKLVNGKCVRMKAEEKRKRAKGAKRGARKKKGKAAQIARKAAKAKAKRKARGL